MAQNIVGRERVWESVEIKDGGLRVCMLEVSLCVFYHAAAKKRESSAHLSRQV